MAAMASDSASRARQFRDALYEPLAGGEPAARDVSPLTVLLTLTHRAAAAAATDEGAAVLLASLGAVARASDVEASLAVAELRFGEPELFREAIYFARCLDRSAADALALLRARRYLRTALIPPAFPDLTTDQEAVLNATTFAMLWGGPDNLRWATNYCHIWRRRYVQAYLGRHAAFNSEIAAIAEQMDSLAASVAAVARLNGLQRLGPPLATAALAQFEELERLFACAVSEERLAQTLDLSPLCPECGYKLGDEAPTADARRVRLAVARGLAGQQTRLAQRVVGRLLARPAGDEEGRLTRFIEVVQASDLSGLALTLDDALVEFLRGLLEAPAEPGPLERLKRAFPEITEANLEAAVAEFRRLVEAELAQKGRLRLAGEESVT